MESVRSPIDLIMLEIVSHLDQVPLLTLICFEFVFLWFMIELTISLINHPACSHTGHRCWSSVKKMDQLRPAAGRCCWSPLMSTTTKFYVWL